LFTNIQKGFILEKGENMRIFKGFIESYTILPISDWQIIEQNFEKKVFHKNDIILAEGSICKYFYFLEQGLIRFYVNKEGNEITKFFTIGPYCFTSKNSFRMQKASEEGIEALTETIVWQTTWKQANELLELKSWNAFTRKFVHEVQNHTEELMLEIKTETAEQRYLKLLAKYPDLIHQIPLKHLSSFLGIAPQSLSRIRKKKIKIAEKLPL
jgi:CRP-like cAMP-binding protein